jgi:hypothetical protein
MNKKSYPTAMIMSKVVNVNYYVFVEGTFTITHHVNVSELVRTEKGNWLSEIFGMKIL